MLPAVMVACLPFSVVCKSVPPSVKDGAATAPVDVMPAVVMLAAVSRASVRYASPPVVVLTLRGVTASMPRNFVEPESNNRTAFVGMAASKNLFCLPSNVVCRSVPPSVKAGVARVPVKVGFAIGAFVFSVVCKSDPLSVKAGAVTIPVNVGLFLVALYPSKVSVSVIE